MGSFVAGLAFEIADDAAQGVAGGRIGFAGEMEVEEMIAEGGGMEREGAGGIEADADLGEGLAFGRGEGADAGGEISEAVEGRERNWWLAHVCAPVLLRNKKARRMAGREPAQAGSCGVNRE